MAGDVLTLLLLLIVAGEALVLRRFQLKGQQSRARAELRQQGGSRRGVITAVDPNLWVPDALRIGGEPILEQEAHFRSWLGFLGGFTGVVGTLLTYELKRYKMKQRIQCPFCEGSGVLTCAACLKTGRTMSSSGDPCVCGNCGGIGVVACVICKGEGTSVPVALQRKELALPGDEFDLALEEMGIAALAANAANQEARKKLEKETTRMKKQLAEEEARRRKWLICSRLFRAFPEKCLREWDVGLFAVLMERQNGGEDWLYYALSASIRIRVPRVMTTRKRA